MELNKFNMFYFIENIGNGSTVPKIFIIFTNDETCGIRGEKIRF